MTKFKMNRTQFMLLTALNMLGSGILMLPAKVALVGGIGLLSWFVVCLAAVAMAYAFANCGIYSKYRLGGLGAIAENAFGMPGSFLTNYIYAFSVVIANVAIATTAVGYLLGIFGIHADLGVVQCLTIALLWLSTLVNFAGVKAMGRFSAVTIWGILIPLLFVLCAAPFSFDTQVFAQNWNPRDLPVLSAVTATAPMMFWAFLGLESACANDDSVDNPEKSVPKAVLAATIAVAVIYVVSTILIAGLLPESELVDSAVLLFLACVGSLVTWQFTMYRVFMTSSRLGYFPALFKRVGRTDVPYMGLFILCIIQTLLVPFMPVSNLFSQFDLLVDISVITNVFPYFLCMAATFVVVRRAGLQGVKKVCVEAAALGSLIFIGWYFSLMDGDVMKFATIVFFLGIAFYGLFVAKDGSTELPDQ
ncbi:MAG: hypothetical protein BHW60_01985 [Sutterella sp. 54_7]|nr:MAG: hypothetical protein BHW60_01985 [Sutterella sp. 54_7]